MAQALNVSVSPHVAITSRVGFGDPTYQAYQILHVAFVVAPLIAGADKFAHLLVNWDTYLAPAAAAWIPFQPHHFMLLVGAVEIIAGLIVAFRPRIGAYVVALWLWAIIANLLLIPGYFDVALRDFGLFAGCSRPGAPRQPIRPNEPEARHVRWRKLGDWGPESCATTRPVSPSRA